jgi:hypothetical protein
MDYYTNLTRQTEIRDIKIDSIMKFLQLYKSDRGIFYLEEIKKNIIPLYNHIELYEHEPLIKDIITKLYNSIPLIDLAIKSFKTKIPPHIKAGDHSFEFKDEPYYKKYYKYKNKYLTLKKQMGKNQYAGNELYIEELKKLYPECVHDHTTIKDAEEYYKKGYATTYGEMDYSAIEKFNNEFNSDKKIKYFIDFGSGRGKLPLFMGDKVNKSIGIELVTERHDDAVKLKDTLSKKFNQITNKVELINGDMFEYLKSVDKSTFDGPVLIWISNLCFGQEITTKLFDELAKKMPSGTVIGSSKIPENIPRGVEPIVDSKSSESKITVSMSWSKGSQIYLHKIK